MEAQLLACTGNHNDLPLQGPCGLKIVPCSLMERESMRHGFAQELISHVHML